MQGIIEVFELIPDRRGRGFTGMACKIFDRRKLVPCKNNLERVSKFVEIVQNRIGTTY